MSLVTVQALATYEAGGERVAVDVDVDQAATATAGALVEALSNLEPWLHNDMGSIVDLEVRAVLDPGPEQRLLGRASAADFGGLDAIVADVLDQARAVLAEAGFDAEA